MRLSGYRHRITAALLIGTALTVTPLAIGAAAAADKAAAYKAPRNSLGQPDLEGSWSNASITLETRPKGVSALVYSEADVKKLEDRERYEEQVGNANTPIDAPINAPTGIELRASFAAAGGASGGYNRGFLDPGSAVMRVHGQPRSSVLTTPDGQVPPYKAGVHPEVKIDYGEDGPGGNSDNPENRTMGDRCILNNRVPMLPNGFYNSNYGIVQSRDEIAILGEMGHDVRHVALNRKTHIAPQFRPYFGDSLGHWEGDTLVVETTNIPKANAYHGSWEHLKLTERFTRVSKDHLLYQFTADDPTMWDKPWGGEYEFYPLKGMIYEYACHEGNYAMEGILAGARQQEHDKAVAAAAAAASTK